MHKQTYTHMPGCRVGDRPDIGRQTSGAGYHRPADAAIEQALLLSGSPSIGTPEV